MPEWISGRGEDLIIVTVSGRETSPARPPIRAKNPRTIAVKIKSGGSLAAAVALLAVTGWPALSGGAAWAQNVSRGETIFQRCAACHSVVRGKANGIGPNLNAIVGQRVASRPKFAYSKALSSAGGVWSRERLDKFLKSPSTAVPGTRMMTAGITSDQDRRDLIAFLERPARP